MAKFTFTAIDGAAKELFRQSGGYDDAWAAMDEAQRNYYRRNAEKILDAAREEIKIYSLRRG